MTKNIESCPYCGGSTRVDILPDRTFAVVCGSCLARGSIKNTADKAIAEWNKVVALYVLGKDPQIALRVVDAAAKMLAAITMFYDALGINVEMLEKAQRRLMKEQEAKDE